MSTQTASNRGVMDRATTRLRASSRARRANWLMFPLVIALGLASSLRAQDYDREPIRYSESEPDNLVSRLATDVSTGKRQLAYDARFGYLPALLQALDVPTDSQMLVFSKTSLQRHRISPRRPRALYFNDEVYVGYCQQGEVLEISVSDRALGTVFYTLDQDPTDVVWQRHTDSCLICHSSSRTDGVPGHVVRSVYSDAGGYPLLSAGTHTIDYTSPLEKRWGGWYVTGSHGEQKHLGNLISDKQTRPERVDNSAGHNVLDLSDRIDISRYLSPGSDIVALMVLEHQTKVHNLITRAGFQTRLAIRDSNILNEALGEPTENLTDSCKRRIAAAGDELLEALLLADEAPLTAEIRGVSSFERTFPKRGPRDGSGRSLRDLDLQTRLFRFPCSYLIYSESFSALPEQVRAHVYRRLLAVLTGQDTSPEYAHLSAADRTAILEILQQTKNDLPADWQSASIATSR